ncbi:lipopolysaccharide biosynthesis protein [Paraburkholderia aspalathi]|uniref:Membrane protein involved in the export of O-antigen and teichoic acid n=1 Tax=Paraburkholderia aspalathi TaxID=1324617 RepID=A0A1I7ELK6_9BURK|nr:lipopolysaccharide biosynthesis protein [Paraburkholderia aspalathi]SFU24813.1 Membrane protein involved in the export of O-antigen and teichoic acid [Paraburkholderia aspalathi]
MSGSLRQSVLSGLFWSLLQNWGGRLVTFILFTLLARLLGPRDFGVFAAAVAVISILEIFVEQGLGDALIQKEHVSLELLNTTFLLNLTLSIALVSLLVAFAPLVAALMKVPQLTNILRVACISTLINAFGFCQQAMYRRNFAYRWLALRFLIATAISGIVGVAVAYAGGGAWSLVAQVICASLINVGLLWAKPQWKLSARFDFRGGASLLRFSSNILGMRILDFGNTRFIEIFIAATLGPTVLGIYAVGVRIYQISMQLLSSAILDVAHSGFSRLAKDREKFNLAYYKATTISATLAVPCFVLLATVAPELCISLFGQKWANSAQVLTPMALLGAVQVIQFYNGASFNALGMPVVTLAINLVKIAFTAFSLWMTLGSDLDHMVVAFVIAQALVTPLNFYLARRKLGIDLGRLFKNVCPVFLACGVMAGAVIMCRSFLSHHELSIYVKFPALLGVGAGVYLALLILFIKKNYLEVLNVFKLRRHSPA